MGSTSTKLRKALQRGNDAASAKILEDANAQFKSKFDPTSLHGTGYLLNNTLHLAAQTRCERSLRILLSVCASVPSSNINSRNMNGESPIHCACNSKDWNGKTWPDDRGGILMILLDANIQVNTRNNMGDTALHVAARSGYSEHVRILLVRGAVASLTNIDGHTPPRCALDAHHGGIAREIEAFSVFSSEEDLIAFGSDQTTTNELSLCGRLCENGSERSGLFRSLNRQNIRAEKDHAIVIVSETLGVPLIAAEAWLRLHSFNKDDALEKALGMSPGELCLQVNVIEIDHEPRRVDTSSLADDAAVDVEDADEFSAAVRLSIVRKDVATCNICLEDGVIVPLPSTFDEISEQAGENLRIIRAGLGCGHNFCSNCWRIYLTTKIDSAESSRGVLCPASTGVGGCRHPVPVEVVDALVDRKIAAKYSMFDLSGFVTASSTIRWCPEAGCDEAVKLIPSTRGVYRKCMRVQCKMGHAWCFSCQVEHSHEPCSCSELDMWRRDVKAVTGVTLNSDREANSGKVGVADFLWLSANTKACPGCSVSIEKDDGCNHMTCRVCRHEFCWICARPWAEHDKASGGFYSCNKFAAGGEIGATGRKGIKNTDAHDAMKIRGKLMECFLHYYTRFETHKKSLAFEQKFLSNALFKVAELRRARESLLRNETFSSLLATKEMAVDERWLHFALEELVATREVLMNSYVFAFYEFGGARRDIERRDSRKDTSTVVSMKPAASNTLGFSSVATETTQAALETIMDIRSSLASVRSERQILFEMQQADLELIGEQLSEMIARRCLRVTRKCIVLTALRARHDREVFCETCVAISSSEQKDPRRKRRSRKKSKKKSDNRRKSSRPIAGDRMLAPSLPWICGACTMQNLGIKTCCDVCDTPRGSMPNASQIQLMNSFGFARGSPTHHTSPSHSSEDIVSWICFVCTMENSPADERCVACRSSREEQSIKIAEEGGFDRPSDETKGGRMDGDGSDDGEEGGGEAEAIEDYKAAET